MSIFANVISRYTIVLPFSLDHYQFGTEILGDQLDQAAIWWSLLPLTPGVEQSKNVTHLSDEIMHVTS